MLRMVPLPRFAGEENGASQENGRGRIARQRSDAMKTLRIGIASPAEMRSRTLAVARGERKLGPDEPKL